jgi:hypothetical protein
LTEGGRKGKSITIDFTAGVFGGMTESTLGDNI